MEHQSQGRPVIFGEVLFDSFPDGSVVMGGAPLNVAWHLRGFGCNPLLVSRVGDDAHGKYVIDTLRDWGLDIAGIQIDDRYPTGKVAVSLQGGQPRFSILADQAYDFIDSTAVQKVLKETAVSLVYHGSLVARNEVSRKALEVVRRCGAPLFVDINLRQPWWERSQVDHFMQGANWLKLNDGEFIELDRGTLDDTSCRSFIARYQVNNLILTLGENGARIIAEDTELSGQPVAVSEIVDTVGAGDAFSSVMILGILSDWSLEQTMPRALEFAAQLCARRGATIAERDVYNTFLKQWDKG